MNNSILILSLFLLASCSELTDSDLVEHFSCGLKMDDLLVDRSFQISDANIDTIDKGYEVNFVDKDKHYFFIVFFNSQKQLVVANRQAIHRFLMWEWSGQNMVITDCKK